MIGTRGNLSLTQTQENWAAALGRYVADPHGSERALSIAKKFAEAGISVTGPSFGDEFIGDFIDFARNGKFEIC